MYIFFCIFCGPRLARCLAHLAASHFVRTRFCEHVYSILAKIDLRLEEGKHGLCKQTPVTNQEISNTGKTESAKVKLPKIELKSFSGNSSIGEMDRPILFIYANRFKGIETGF